MSGRFIAIGLIILIGTSASGSVDSKIKSGTEAYREGKFDQALEDFIDAEVERPEDPRLRYNIANVYYKMQNYEEAIKAYLHVAVHGGLDLEQKSYFNLGNTFFRQGKLTDAVEYYKKALELDPNDQDAKHNLEFTREEMKRRIEEEKKRKEQEEKNQQGKDQGQEQGGGQDNPDDQNQQQKGNDKQDQADSKEEKDQQEKGKEGDREKEGEDATTQAQKDDSSEKDKQQRGEGKQLEAKRLSREEAEKWLQSLSEEERKNLKQQRARTTGSYRGGKDW